MTLELLLPIHLEVPFAVIDHYLVVHGLAGEVLLVRMHGGRRYGMHIRLTDVFGHHRNTELPQIHLLVIGRRHKPSPILYECDRVYRPQMLLILLNNLLCIDVELQNLLVGAASQKNVLLVLCGVKLDAERHSLVGEALDNFARLCVPQLDDAVESRTEELLAIVGEADVADGFLMAHVGP
jgi:hypothetical protein